MRLGWISRRNARLESELNKAHNQQQHFPEDSGFHVLPAFLSFRRWFLLHVSIQIPIRDVYYSNLVSAHASTALCSVLSRAFQFVWIRFAPSYLRLASFSLQFIWYVILQSIFSVDLLALPSRQRHLQHLGCWLLTMYIVYDI